MYFVVWMSKIFYFLGYRMFSLLIMMSSTVYLILLDFFIHDRYAILEEAENILKGKMSLISFSKQIMMYFTHKIGKWVYIPFKFMSNE